ncbi:hypothetical protein P9112_005858 [Eukaryota sp. TZLM1-RC]
MNRPSSAPSTLSNINRPRSACNFLDNLPRLLSHYKLTADQTTKSRYVFSSSSSLSFSFDKQPCRKHIRSKRDVNVASLYRPTSFALPVNSSEPKPVLSLGKSISNLQSVMKESADYGKVFLTQQCSRKRPSTAV